MPYIVYIKQSATGIVRTRVEDSEWRSDSRLWTRGSRACDCARALLFAQDQEVATCPCGVSAYAIQVIGGDGVELYCETGFDETVSGERPDGEDASIDIGLDRADMGARLGAFARQAFDRLALQVTQYAGRQDTQAGRPDQR